MLVGLLLFNQAQNFNHLKRHSVARHFYDGPFAQLDCSGDQTRSVCAACYCSVQSRPALKQPQRRCDGTAHRGVVHRAAKQATEMGERYGATV